METVIDEPYLVADTVEAKSTLDDWLETVDYMYHHSMIKELLHSRKIISSLQARQKQMKLEIKKEKPNLSIRCLENEVKRRTLILMNREMNNHELVLSAIEKLRLERILQAQENIPK